MRILLLLFAAFIPPAASDGVPQCDRSDGSNPHRYDPLACWLWNMRVAIPNQSFKESFITVQIQDMTCTNFTMASIDTSYSPSSSDGATSNPAIKVAVSGISATCLGRYHVTGGIGGGVQVWVQQSPEQKHSVELSLVFMTTVYDDKIRMASSVNATSCQANLEVSSLHFEGSISARLINLFKSSISGYVSGELSSSLCPAIEPELSNDLTKIIQQADNIIIPLLPNETAAIDGTKKQTLPTRGRARRQASRNDTVTLVDWAVDTPVLYRGLELVNLFLDRYLHKGFFVDTMQYLKWNVAPSLDCGYFFGGINGLLHTLTDGKVTIDIPVQVQNITFVVPGYGRVRLNIHQLRVEGVDAFTNIELIKPDSNVSFSSALATDSDFNITVSMTVEVSSIDGGVFQGDPLKESFSMSANSSRARIGSTLMLNYDKTLFQNIHMQDIIITIQNYSNMSEWLCLLAPIQSLDIVDLNLDVNLSSIVFTPTGSTGTLEKDMDAMLNSLLKLFLTEYSTLVRESLIGLVEGPAQHALTDFVNGFIDHVSTQTCREIPEKDAPEYVNFHDFGFLHQLNDFLKQSLGVINQYISCVADVFNRSNQPVSFEVENVHVNLTNISIKNPACIKQLEILVPAQDAYEVNNLVSYGQCDNMTDSSGLFAALSISSTLFEFKGNFNITAWMDNATVSGGSRLKYDLKDFRRLPLSTLLSDGLSLSTPIADMVLSTPGEFMDGLGLNLSSMLESRVFNSTRVTFSTETHTFIPEALESVLQWGSTSVIELGNGMMKAVLNKTSIEPEPDVDSATVRMAVAVAAGGFVAANVLFLCFWLCKRLVFWCKRQRESFLDTDLMHPLLEDDPYLEIEPSEEHIVEMDVAKDTSNGRLILHEAVPDLVRHFFPVAIILALFLLLSSNLSVGASVDLIISSDSGKTVTLPSLFAFSLGNTAREMYYAGIYSLLFLVVGFSGIWPYAKLLLMLFGWCSNLLSLEQRGCILFLLDALGKFSLVDTFVLVLMMVSFRYHLVLDGLLTLDVFVNPGFGFFGFLLATTLSLVAGHVILFFHRKSIKNICASDGTRDSLCRHKFDDEIHGAPRRMTIFFSGFIVAILVLTAVFLAIGMTQKCFLFEIGGLAGKLLGDNQIKSYSLLTLGTSLSQSAENPSFAMTCLQTAYFFYAVIMPFSCLIALGILFLVPMILPWQQRILVICEISNAWSAIEVFVLSIIASLLELSTFASFIIGDKCSLLNGFLAENFHEQLDGQDSCYTVSSSVSATVWYLVCGAILNSMIVSFLLKVAHRAIHERMDRQGHETDALVVLDTQDKQKMTSRDLVSILLGSKWLSGILFVKPKAAFVLHEQVEPFGGDNNNERSNHNRRASQGSQSFWEEWREVCSVT